MTSVLRSTAGSSLKPLKSEVNGLWYVEKKLTQIQQSGFRTEKQGKEDNWKRMEKTITRWKMRNPRSSLLTSAHYQYFSPCLYCVYSFVWSQTWLHFHFLWCEFYSVIYLIFVINMLILNLFFVQFYSESFVFSFDTVLVFILLHLYANNVACFFFLNQPWLFSCMQRKSY